MSSVALSQSRFDRILLHMAAAVRAGHLAFHLAGIARELARH